MTASVNFARKVECEEDGIYFSRCFFKQRFSQKMVIGPHHKVIQAALDRTMLPPDHPDFISRLIINVSPGYTKTELCSINYMARGFSVNPMARFLHLSYSEKLALLNSTTAREIVKSKFFQDMWPVVIKSDTDSKSIWHTNENGGVTAAPSRGQVTGFRGGHMDFTKFTGAVIIDDPVKPDDAYSDVIREDVNNRFNETIASRVAVESVPIIIVMQRIHHDDLSGYLLRGGSGEKWHHLNLPVIIDNSKEYPQEYTHGINIDHGLDDGWLWPFKHNEAHEVALKAHRRRWRAQYLQDPIKRNEESTFWNEKLISVARSAELAIEFYKTRTVVAIDPATTNNKTSDEHGIIVASSYNYNDAIKYKILADFSRKGSPLTWAQAAIEAVDQHEADAIVIETNQGGDMCESNLRNAGYTGRIIRVHAVKGKTLRAEPIVALYEQGLVEHGSGLLALEEEMLDFDPATQKSNGKSPNRIDACVYALSSLSGSIGDIGSLLDMAMGNL